MGRPLLLASPEPLASGGDLIALQHRRERRLGELRLGFEQPPSVRVPRLSLSQNISLAAALDVVTQEAGLEAQDWRCHDCGAAIGAIFSPPASARSVKLSSIHTAPPPSPLAPNVRGWLQGASTCTLSTASLLERSERQFREDWSTNSLRQSKSYQDMKPAVMENVITKQIY